MSSITTEIQVFYRQTFADLVTSIDAKTSTPIISTKIHPIPRLSFATGAVLATGLLVQKVALFSIILIANVFTLALSKSLTEALKKPCMDAFLYTGAVFVGLFGTLFPQTTNEKILEIPAKGSIISLKEDGAFDFAPVFDQSLKV